MKFLRHLTAVVLTVAVIVGLGMLWAHVSGGGDIRRPPSHEAVLRMKEIKAGVLRVHSDNGFDPARTADLIRTCAVEALLAAIVITISAARRRRGRARRAAVRA